MSGNGRNGLLPGRVGIASLLLGLLSVVSQTGLGLSSSSADDMSCAVESALCLADTGCSDCFETLLGFADSSIADPSNFEECTEVYDSLCGLADVAGCDTTNTVLLDLATCLAQTEYQCSDFVACNPDVLGATPAPSITNGATTAPTATETTMAPAAASVSPSAPTADETPIAGTSEPRDAGIATSGAFRSSATHTSTALGMVIPAAITAMLFVM